MPVEVTLVYGDQVYAEAVADAIRANGHNVLCFTDPLPTLQYIEAATEPLALLTGVRFGTGRLHGIALGLMARWKHPGTKLLFIVTADDADHAREIGRIVPAGSEPAEVAAVFEDLLLEE